MADPNKNTKSADDKPKQPFVSKDERPDVQLQPDTPLAELRVRDLAAILGSFGGKTPFEVGKTPLKDFFDKPFPEIAKDYVKDIKPEKIEKPEKLEKNEKLEKHEKLEKRENKELKLEKLEHDGVFDPGDFRRPDPRMEQIIQAVAGLTKQVAQLADQLEELRKKTSG